LRSVAFFPHVAGKAFSLCKIRAERGSEGGIVSSVSLSVFCFFFCQHDDISSIATFGLTKFDVVTSKLLWRGCNYFAFLFCVYTYYLYSVHCNRIRRGFLYYRLLEM